MSYEKIFMCISRVFVVGVIGVFGNMVVASDTGVHRLFVQQAVGTVFALDLLEGGFRLSGFPSSTGIFRSTFPVSGIVDLSNGSYPYTPNTLLLQQSLILHDVATVSSLGSIVGNGHSFDLSKSVALFPVNTTPEVCEFSNLSVVCRGDLVWQAPRVLFSGNCVIDGQGNRVTLAKGATISVAENSTLLFENVAIKNLSDSKLLCESSTSTVIFRNVLLELEDSMQTWTGSFIVDGPAVCVLKEYSWSFDGDALLTVDGFTLWKDQAGAARVGGVEGNVEILNGGAILQQASGDTRMMQSDIFSLQGWVYTSQRAGRRSPARPVGRR